MVKEDSSDKQTNRQYAVSQCTEALILIEDAYECISKVLALGHGREFPEYVDLELERRCLSVTIKRLEQACAQIPGGGRALAEKNALKSQG